MNFEAESIEINLHEKIISFGSKRIIDRKNLVQYIFIKLEEKILKSMLIFKKRERVSNTHNYLYFIFFKSRKIV